MDLESSGSLTSDDAGAGSIGSSPAAACEALTVMRRRLSKLVEPVTESA